MIAEREMEAYLSTLRSHLGPMTLNEREEILLEIAAHIRDAQEERAANLDEVLMRLGPAEELAAQYRDGMLVRRASRSYSPVVLLRGALRLATKSASGVFVALVAIFGYTLGAGMVLSGLLKPILPGNTGVWVRDGRLVSSGTLFPPPIGAHEVLGSWYILLMVVLGSLTLLATMYLIRAALRLSKTAQMRLR
jgi:uncharacterized membrane protein